MFLHENDLYMGGWVGRAPFFFHLKNRKKGCVAGGGGLLGKICFVMGVLIFSGTKYICVILLEQNRKKDRHLYCSCG